MLLKRIDVIKSPLAENRLRIIGEVIYDDKTKKSEYYWFDIPKKYAEFVSNSGNPWLVCLIPLAVTIGEPLRICSPVDDILFRNTQELMYIWKCWYPHLHIVSIEAEIIDNKEFEFPAKTASFFTGGIDSFFTVLSHNDSSYSCRQINVDDLINVWGFDIPFHNSEAFRRMRDILQRVASDLGKELVVVATNLRETQFQKTDWGYLSHNCALVSAALILEKRYKKVLIPSTGGYKDLKPWGSHVLTDQLLSTNLTEVIHDGAFFDRVTKTEFVAKSDIALRSLKVCWKTKSEKNCSACSKCLRTMLTLELFGVLEKCSTFGQVHPDVAMIERLYLSTEHDIHYFSDIRALALKKGRTDIVQAITRVLKNSANLTGWLHIVKSIHTKRFVWRWAEPFKNTLLKKYIT